MALVGAKSEPRSQAATVGRAIGAGAAWGIAGGLVMAMYAMVAGATYLRTGFFTPMYHIASTSIAPTAMMTSMQLAAEGQLFHLALGPAALGMLIHLAVGATYGIGFALLARTLNLSGLPAILVGALYGVAVLLFSSFVGLPLAASVFGGGEPIANMPAMVGWTTFTIEHVLFGIVLGLPWLAQKRPRTRHAGVISTR